LYIKEKIIRNFIGYITAHAFKLINYGASDIYFKTVFFSSKESHFEIQ